MEGKSNAHKIKLRIYNSFEEATRSEAADAANKSRLDGLRDTVALIMRVYGVTEESLRERRKKLHIKILAPK